MSNAVLFNLICRKDIEGNVIVGFTTTRESDYGREGRGGFEPIIKRRVVSHNGSTKAIQMR